MANGLRDWFRRYWLYLVIAAITLLVIVLWLLPTGSAPGLKIIQETEEEVKKLKGAKKLELEILDTEMEERTQELVTIKSIDDEDERLKQLAEFSNKRRRL